MAGKADPKKIATMAQREPELAPDMLASDGAPTNPRGPMLPQPCPVTPLGVNGSRVYFLDRLHQVIDSPPEMQKGSLKLWFGDSWLREAFPQKPKGWKEGDPIQKFDQDDAQTALLEDCHALGIFSPQGRIFGRGAHRFPGDPAQLVVHLGDRVWRLNAPGPENRGKGKRRRDVQQHPPGEVREGDRRAFFPAAERLPRPAETAATVAEVAELLDLIRDRWAWTEPDASAMILLGHIAQMYVCGALEWRAHVWLAAPTAAGKSTLQKLIRMLHEDWAVMTEDASEAALRQVLGDDTRPVLIDEAEAHDKPERLAAILNLIKKSSTGAKIYRGTQDHKAQSFTAQSCFLLSSVLHAQMRGEDRNRIAILEMRTLPASAPKLELDPAKLVPLGRRLFRRMLDQWARFDATFDAYRDAIGRAGFEGRWRDTYGTFLACLDLLRYSYPVDDVNLSEEAGRERVDQAVRALLPAMLRGRVESRSDVDRCLVHLASHLLPGSNGKPPETVGRWIERAMTMIVRPGQFVTDPEVTEIDEEARARLKSYGLRCVNVETIEGKQRISDARPGAWQDAYLAVAYATCKPLEEIFRGSEWTGGGWIQSLAKVEGQLRAQNKVRFSSKANPDNAILVPLRAFTEG